MAAEAEFFPQIKPVIYNPAADASELLVFRHYNADEVVLGKTMHDWCRFAVCYWHTFRYAGADPFGPATAVRCWDESNPNSMETAKRRMHAAFELMSKLGVKYWTFHDRDIAPEGATLEETNRNLDEIADLAEILMQKTGIKLLWGTANLFSNPRYMNGAATNPDAYVLAYAGAQVKKAMEITHRLGGENYVFWGGREGYQSLLNTNVKKEIDHLAAFLKMAVAHKEKIGFGGQLLIEPKPKEPTAHQYDYDAQTVWGFLKCYGLDAHYKVNIEPNHTTLAGHSFEHDIEVASRFGYLGSIDSNTGSASLGWDTDQFPMNLRDCTMVMRAVIRQGGLAPGGLNFDCKVRRESTDIEDIFIGHIGAMDCFALALKRAAYMHTTGTLDKLIAKRYESYDSGIGAKIEAWEATLDELSAYVLAHGEPTQRSGKQEAHEVLFNNELHKF